MSKLGVDCDNVILCQMNGTPVSGALKSLRIVAQSGVFAPKDIWIVSKCSPRVQHSHSLVDYRRTDVSMIIVRSWEELLPHLLEEDKP
jgi:hypothetical protein